MQDNFTDAWYLLRCRQNYWKTIQRNLNDAGLKTCCPLILERRRRSDKKNAYRLTNSPAFPGYIFVRFNPDLIHTTAIKRIPGAMDFVRFGNNIATIHQNEIDALRTIHNDLPASGITSSHNHSKNATPGNTEIPEELQNILSKIYNEQDPEARVNVLLSMLQKSSPPARRNNVN